MRKIEQQMLKAIQDKRNWQSGNTVVQNQGPMVVKLHGNVLGEQFNGKFHVNVQTLRNWPSPTTKSRLRALGVDVYTRKHVTYLNGEAI